MSLHLDMTQTCIYVKDGDELICRMTSLEEARKLIKYIYNLQHPAATKKLEGGNETLDGIYDEEIKKLQDQNKEYFDKLVKATCNNGLYLNALKELFYNNNPAPAEEILQRMDPKFSDHHIVPAQFLNLKEETQDELFKRTKISRGDVFYNTEEEEFYVVESIKDSIITMYRRGVLGLSSYRTYKHNINESYIPCYSSQQLLDILESLLVDRIGYYDLIKIHKSPIRYEIYCNYALLGYGKTKVDALWNSVVKMIEP